MSLWCAKICPDLRDFLRQNLIDTCWTPSGKFGLRNHKTILIESLETSISGFSVHTKNHIKIPKRHIIVLNAKVNPIKEHLGQMYNVQPNMILQNEYPALITIPTIHRAETLRPMIVPHVFVNLLYDSIFLPKEELLGSLESMKDNIQKIITSTWM